MKTCYYIAAFIVGLIAMAYPTVLYKLDLPEWMIIGGGFILAAMLAADLVVSKRLEGKKSFGPGAFLCIQMGILPVVIIPENMSQWAVIAYTVSYTLPALAAFSGFVWEDVVSYYALEEKKEAK